MGIRFANSALRSAIAVLGLRRPSGSSSSHRVQITGSRLQLIRIVTHTRTDEYLDRPIVFTRTNELCYDASTLIRTSERQTSMQLVSDAAALGKIVRNERKHQELTQTKLAHYAGVGINFISQLERGKETMELGKVIRVLQTLGIDLFAIQRSGR